MITTFGDRGTEDIFNGQDTKPARRTCPKDVWPVARRKLDMLNAARDTMDLAAARGNNLEKLKGNWAGYFSMRVNDQYRVAFKFANGNASDVQIVDYH